MYFTCIHIKEDMVRAIYFSAVSQKLFGMVLVPGGGLV